MDFGQINNINQEKRILEIEMKINLLGKLGM